ncbi:hypothetical protein BDP81DRAFT_1734 [Colletotrichum phormii]|uniref:Uncharacterized protein n=1 Tax=Colletotrichum phormii TaxID=359342 RepID=A0AAJ0EKJ6_9PEZI|nr:uncharacterized protein BDP81DRAFT_1734 [Colletotrichum phormii]KAK1655276.1 hypothetical protein BDP81DRAFT_1734 [Colletotrichum phormii]
MRSSKCSSKDQDSITTVRHCELTETGRPLSPLSCSLRLIARLLPRSANHLLGLGPRPSLPDTPSRRHHVFTLPPSRRLTDAPLGPNHWRSHTPPFLCRLELPVYGEPDEVPSYPNLKIFIGLLQFCVNSARIARNREKKRQPEKKEIANS